jgi:hypothetical protein
MSAQDRPPSVGELVVRNGKKAGTRVPLALPVTVIGRHSGCDVKLSAAGVADFHCLVTITPAGPVLRSWQPEQTHRNGKPVAASLLADGDELKVGPCVFEFHWAAAPPDQAAKSDLPPDLLAQVAQARELFRLERERETAALASRTADADRLTERARKLRELAKSERTKARLVYRRFLKRMRTRWGAERRAVEAERQELARDRAAHAAQVERADRDRERQAAQLNDYKRRLYDAWGLLAENQKRLLSDRQQAEAWATGQTAQLDRRGRELDERERRLADNRATLEARVNSLVAEIAGLEARALNTRALLRQLEDQRGRAEAAGPPEPSTRGLVTLDGGTYQMGTAGEADRLLVELHDSQQAAGRERAKLAAQRADLDREAEDLADQRAVLVEQVAALAAARDLWHGNELTTVAELEGLARAVRARELAADERERGLVAAERERRQREYDLWQLRVKLEGWQAALAAHEATAAADRDRADAELDAKRELLARWQESLDVVRQTWAAVREQEKAHLATELGYWAEMRAKYTAAVDEADRAKTRFLTETEKLAPRVLAVEENAGDPRRVRVLRKRWEAHFARFRKELSARKVELAAEQLQAEDRLRELHTLSADLMERQTARTAEKFRADQEALSAALAAEERARALSLEKARRERGERELAELRAEIDRLSRLLGEPPPPLADDEPDVIPLLPRAA